MRLPSPLLASAFAKTCGAELHGPDQHIHGVNEIHRVEAGDLTFVDHPKYYTYTLKSAASIVLMDALPDTLPEEASAKTLLVHPEPFAIYDALVREHRPPYVLNDRIAVSTNIHPSAVVEPGAVIGPKVTIGAHTRVEANAIVYGPTRIGARCRIGAGSIVGDLAFYFRGIGEKGRQRWTTGGDVVLEDYVEVGPNCNIARGVSSTTRIGRGTKLDALCMVAHGTVIGENCLLAAQVGIAGKCNIGNRVTIYGQAGIGQNITIGDEAIIGAQAGVSKNLPGGQLYLGSPAAPKGEYYRAQATLRRMTR